MPRKTINWTNPTEAAARAAEVGFPFEVLTPTAEVWISAMNSGTDLHAENYAGTIAWHEAVKTLRLHGLALGLEKLVRNGVQLCFCPTTRVAVMIAQGDPRTGDAANLHIKPSTKYPRGPVSCAVLRAQLTLFPMDAKPLATDEYEVWIFMLHMTPSGETRAELSRPSVIQVKTSSDGDETGTIVDWYERIFLGSFEAGPIGGRRAIPDDLTPTGAVDVPVKKRA